MSRTARLFVIVGNPGSGKDDLIQAVRDMGTRHASIVPKHASRGRRKGDGDEMICDGDPDFDLDNCDIKYESYGQQYGIKSSAVWAGLSAGTSQVVVVSQVGGINRLRSDFGALAVLVYVHSEMTREEYERHEGVDDDSDIYVSRRSANYQLAFQIYVENIRAFDHVLIGSATREDVYDQLFRVFRAYELGPVG